MEQKKKIFGALDDLMRSPIGDRLRERVFRELSTKEIHDLLQREQKPYKELPMCADGSRDKVSCAE